MTRRPPPPPEEERFEPGPQKGDAANNLFLLGAGFTKAACPDAPLNAELLPALAAADPARSIFRDYQKLYGTDDVEQLLTRLDLDLLSAKGQGDTKRTARFQAERRHINAEIASFFARFRFSEAAVQANPSLRMFAERSCSPATQSSASTTTAFWKACWTILGSGLPGTVTPGWSGVI